MNNERPFLPLPSLSKTAVLQHLLPFINLLLWFTLQQESVLSLHSITMLLTWKDKGILRTFSQGVAVFFLNL